LLRNAFLAAIALFPCLAESGSVDVPTFVGGIAVLFLYLGVDAASKNLKFMRQVNEWS